MLKTKQEGLNFSSICTVPNHEFNTRRMALGILLLSIGGFIYIAFRPDSILLFRFIEILNLSNFTTCCREFFSNINIPEFIIYSLPDGLWTASYILIMTGIWKSPGANQVLFSAFLPFIGVISEIGQYFGIVKGTPDYADLICYIIPFLIYIVALKLNSK